jgi:hypothetical protein
MAERRPVVTSVKLKYSGLFNCKDLWKFIEDWFKDQGFADRVEVYHDEKVTKTHKDIDIKYMPYRKMSDYVKIEQRLLIKVFNLVNKTVVKDGHNIKLGQGDIDITFDGYINTDYEGRWENTPNSFFIRTIIDKFIFRTYTGKYEAIIKEQIQSLKHEIESFLNMYKY